MNEAMLEILYSARMDALDRALTETHKLTQGQYDAAVEALDLEFKPKFERAAVLSRIVF